MNAQGPEAAITAWLATQQEAMLGVLEAMVNTDGGSYDKAGVDAVLHRLNRPLVRGLARRYFALRRRGV